MLLSRRLRALLVLVVVAGALVAGISYKYVWIYLTRKPVLRPLAQDLLSDPKTSNNPEALLEEANRLAGLFNWPKAEPLYVRAEELFREKRDSRNETYARVGRIRSQSERMSWGDVSDMVGDALLSAMASGDVGGQVRYLEMLGNGFNEAKRYGEALAFFERAIKTSRANPDSGFPFMAFEGESESLVSQGKVSEARDKLESALTVARQNQKLGHETMILQLLGELAVRTGDHHVAMKYLKQSGDLAQKYKFYRTVGQSMIDLAGLYREAGDLQSAEQSATLGVDASRRVGDRYYLPRDLTVLADLKAQRGSFGEAESLYENAEDVIDGMLVNLHEEYWSSSLAGAMSETY